MTELRWTRDTVFADHRRGVVARGPGVYDVPEAAVEEYLGHPCGGWERPEDPEDEDDGDDTDANDTAVNDEADTEDERSEFDVDAFLDRTPMEDVVADIAAGVTDGHLDAVAEAAERKGVQEAVKDRRAALSEG